MPEPNMTLSQLERWTNTQAFQEYKQHRGASTVNAVLRRTRKVIRGTASEQERQKVSSFIARMRANDAGERKFGSGAGAVSARTASLRNWGWDATGRFS